jgi:hypothetical protein
MSGAPDRIFWRLSAKARESEGDSIAVSRLCTAGAAARWRRRRRRLAARGGIRKPEGAMEGFKEPINY